MFMNRALQIAAGLSQETEVAPRFKTLAQFERDYIQMVLDLNCGDISKAAKILDVSPSTLYRKRSLWNE